MATPSNTELKDSSALRGYFETSLYLLLLVSALSLISTGKLDLVSMLATPAALLFKGYRWWHGHEPEISDRTANLLGDVEHRSRDARLRSIAGKTQGRA